MSSGSRFRYCLVLLVALVSATAPSSAAFAQEDVNDAIQHAKALSLAFRQAAESAMPSVVTLIAKTKPRAGADREDLRRLLQDPRFRRMLPEGALPPENAEDSEEGTEQEGNADDLPALPSQIGAGVIVDASGLILTNNHVVQGADEIIVRLDNGQELKVSEVKTDPLSDLAIVRIGPDKPLRPARLGDSSQLNIGDWVIAIGSPFELEATVSAGIISGKGRGIDKIRRGKLIQTDAAINPGNSGGPLVNLTGEVVGINTAIATNSGAYQGIGFAIPVNRVKWVVEELQRFGKVRRAFLGIQIDELTPEAAAKLGLAARSGVYVTNVLQRSPAESAGLKTNDVIVEFAGERVFGPRDLQDVVEQKPIDSQQEVKVMRDKKSVTLTVTLQALPE
jgi:serine protease Do